MPDLKAPIPAPYDLALAAMRTAESSQQEKADAARLRQMNAFRSHILATAATSRAAAAQPTTTKVHTQPPNSYDEALMRRQR